MGPIGWLVALGCLLMGAAIGIWGLTDVNKSIAIWLVGVPGAVCLVVAAGLEFQKIASDIKSGPNESEIINQRAYVIVEGSELRFVGGEKPSEGWVSLKNNGLTPAFDLERWATIFAAKFPHVEFERSSFGNARSVLGPGGAVDFGPIRMSRNLTFAEAEEVARGTMAIYVYGEVRYRDSYKITRCTNFRLMYRGTGGRPAGAVPLQQLPEGNNYDCPK
jgi:hypothetical protein